MFGFGRITINPKQWGGRPWIRGTRIRVKDVCRHYSKPRASTRCYQQGDIALREYGERVLGIQSQVSATS